MATMIASRPVFIDTNVLVATAVASAPLHAIAVEALERHTRMDQSLVISRQVLRDYLATLSRPQTFARPQPSAVLAA